jgi:hypothetical protein
MKKPKTPRPDSEEYNVEKPQDLNIPKFHSSTDYRNAGELPSVENLNDQSEDAGEGAPTQVPETNLGKKRKDDEDDRERIINK